MNFVLCLNIKRVTYLERKGITFIVCKGSISKHYIGQNNNYLYILQ